MERPVTLHHEPHVAPMQKTAPSPSQAGDHTLEKFPGTQTDSDLAGHSCLCKLAGGTPSLSNRQPRRRQRRGAVKPLRREALYP